MKTGEVFNPWRMFSGALIPESILSSSELPAGAKTLYGQLKRYSGEDGRCFPSQVRLAADLAVSVRTIQRNLRILVEAGLIAPIRKRPGYPQAYVFLWNSLLESCQKVLGDTTVLSSQTRQNCRVPYRKKRTNEESHIDKTALVVAVEMWKTRPVAGGDGSQTREKNEQYGQGKLNFETEKSTGTSAPTSAAMGKSAELSAVRPAELGTMYSIPPGADRAEELAGLNFAEVIQELGRLKAMPAGRAVSDRTSKALARLQNAGK
jgi:hypothetical protein